MTKTLLGSALLVAAIALSAGPARAADTIDTTKVLVKLHQSDEKEIAMGKLAQKGGKSPESKSFGKTLVKDHTAADKKVLKLAKEEKLDLGSTPAADLDGAVAKMAAASDFDAHFARIGVDPIWWTPTLSQMSVEKVPHVEDGNEEAGPTRPHARVQG
jgi:predicted outer membrane protein